MSTDTLEAKMSPEEAEPLEPTRHPRGPRVLALSALIGVVAALGTVFSVAVGSGSSEEASSTLQSAAAPAWEASRALSVELDALEAGQSRRKAGAAASVAAEATERAAKAVRVAPIPTSQTPQWVAHNRALAAQATWIAAVRATLKDPAARERGRVARLATFAIRRAKALDRWDLAPEGTVRGTGHLLSATKQRG